MASMNTHARRRTAWRLLEALGTLSFIPAVRWLRFVRGVVWLSIVAFYAVGLRIDALLLLLVALVVEVMLFRIALVEVLKGREE